MTARSIVIIFITLGILIYFSSLLNGFVWDDEEQIVNNTLVHSLKNLPPFFQGSTFNTGGSGSLAGLYYKPLMNTAFSFIYSVFGQNAFFFHLFQVFLHILNTILVFYLFKKFFHKNIAVFLSSIFLVHPINTEAVSYISALQEVLFFVFGITALLLFDKNLKIKFLDQRVGKIIIPTILILLLVSSLLSKESGILFLLILPIFIYFFQKKKLFVSLIITSTSLVIYLSCRFLAGKISLISQGPSPIMLASFNERMQSIPQIIFYYLKTFFLPKDLSISQHWVVRTVDFKNFYLPLIFIIIFLILIFFWHFFLWQKSKPLFKITLFFSIWFVIGLFLHLQIVPLDMTVADRWFYFPMIGLLGIFGTMLTKFRITNFSNSKYFIFAALILLSLSARTFFRNFDWKDGLTLFSHDIKLQTESYDLENNLGTELFRAKRYGEAETHFLKSTQLAPYWWTNWSNLGVVVERKGRLEDAKNYYQKAIDQGNYHLAYENMAGLLLFKERGPKQAIEFTQLSLKKLPYNHKLWLILVLSYYQTGEKDKALTVAQKYFQLLPNQQSYYLYDKLTKNQPLNLE